MEPVLYSENDGKEMKPIPLITSLDIEFPVCIWVVMFIRWPKFVCYCQKDRLEDVEVWSSTLQGPDHSVFGIALRTFYTRAQGNSESRPPQVDDDAEYGMSSSVFNTLYGQ